VGLFKNCEATPWLRKFAWLPTRLTVSGEYVWLTSYCEVSLMESSEFRVVKTWRCLPQNRADVNLLIRLEIAHNNLYKDD
jgi:hypothetical protein